MAKDHTLIITLYANGINISTKKNWLHGYKSKGHILAVCKRPTSDLWTHRLKVHGKMYPTQMKIQRKLE